MGFLPNDSNNIVIDAVLTDIGREFLARNDGSFNISKFALADDGVDYTIIKKFGRTVGKEKIEKNTPILEANTRSDQALQSKLLSTSRSTFTRLPTLSANAPRIALDLTTNTTKKVEIAQGIQSGLSISNALVDTVYEVKVDNRLVQIEGARPRTVDSNNKATYFLTRDAILDTVNGGSKLSTTFKVKSLNKNHFDTLGDGAAITSFAEVKGLTSGQGTTLEFNLNKTS